MNLALFVFVVPGLEIKTKNKKQNKNKVNKKKEELQQTAATTIHN